MMWAILLLAFAAQAQDVPYLQDSVKKNQDIGAMGSNFRGLSDKGKDSVGGTSVPGDWCWDDPTLCVDSTNHKILIDGVEFDTMSYTAASSSTLTAFAWNTTNTSFLVCVATLTITINANSRLLIGYSGSGNNNVSGSNVCSGFLVDHAFVAPYTNAIPASSYLASANGAYGNLSFTALTEPLAVGEHDVCLGFFVSGNTGGNVYGQKFWITEVK